MPFTETIEVTAGQHITDHGITLSRQTEISGTVTFSEGPGALGTVHLLDADGVEVDSVDFTNVGGDFRFFTATGGNFTLETSTLEPVKYVPVIYPVEVTIGTDVSGIVLEMPLAALITGTVTFEGPDSPGTIQVFNTDTGLLRYETDFTTAGDAFQYYLPPGDFRFLLTPGVELDLYAAGFRPIFESGNILNIMNKPIQIDIYG